MATTSIPHRWKYDVFVSFRGGDIRKTFMDHLFKDFKQKGIHAFRDDNELPKGEEISPQLYKAIEESRFLIVIFSKNYASSTWCLRELVKILECKKIENPKHEVRIIFYDVKPDVVRRQKRSYAEAFINHEVSNKTEVDNWKEALSMAAGISGWDLQDMTNGFESKFIDSISGEIVKTLCDGPLDVGENLVGIDFHFDKSDLSRFVGSDNVKMIGICGISGIGKTTLAKAIYNSMYVHFEGSCFCEGVREKRNLAKVQRHMIEKIMKTENLKISNVSEGAGVLKQRMPCKPVLLVLDDVDDRKQLESLAGSDSWFCKGSLIIFTCKDKQLLKSHGVDEIHEMDFLDEDRSLELFRSYAFKEKDYPIEFEGVSQEIVNFVQGHPLALKVLGGLLYGKTVGQWKSELKSLKVHPNDTIPGVLRLSYDGLNPRQQNILLDIAFLFIEENSDFVASILDRCNFFAVKNMQVLFDKSLITVSRNNSLQMHGLIQAMAREIVSEESRRLLISSNVYDILGQNEVEITEAVEVLVISLEKFSQKVQIDAKDFALMKKLRILKIYQEEKVYYHTFPLSERKRELEGHDVIFSGENLDYLSNKLSLFYWHGCPFECLPSDFYPKNIVAIDLSYSNIKQLWTTPKCLGRLKIMKLRYCCNLTTTPDFSEIKNLEELDLEGCVNLVTVHPSIGMLNRLVVLNMRDCRRATSFPSKVEMDSLQVLNLSGCLNVNQGSSWLTSMLGFIWNQQHPQRSVSLEALHMLKYLNLRYCNLVQVPDGLGGLSCLKELNLEGNNFTSLPSLIQLSHLQILEVNGCKKLEVLPELPHGLKITNASDCTSLCSVTGSNPINGRTCLRNCPKLFKNLAIDSQVSISETQSVTSQGSTNRISSFLGYARIQNNRCGFFRLSSIENMDIIYDGNSIPNYFTNRRIGNRIKVELPLDWSFSKLRGYGICVVFKRKKPSTISTSFGYKVRNFDGALLGGFSPFYYVQYFRDKPIRIDESDMIWLHYTRTEIQKLKKAENFVTFCFHEDEAFEVKKMGVRLVFDEDLDQEAADLSMFQDLPTLSQHGGALCLFNGFCKDRGFIKLNGLVYTEWNGIEWSW